MELIFMALIAGVIPFIPGDLAKTPVEVHSIRCFSFTLFI
jgi:hypothetical protein